MVKEKLDKSELIKLRSEVIDASIDLENHINYLIQFKYFKKPDMRFCMEVLCDPYFGFALKMNILEKAFPGIDDKIFENMRRMNSVRNYFAHSSDNFVMGDKEGKPERLVAVYTDKKRLSKEIDFRELYDEFFELEKLVKPQLKNTIIELGGKWSTLDPM